MQTTYSLRPALSAPALETGFKTARIVEIARPSVPPGFEGDRIALYLAQGQKLDYFAAAKWPAGLDDVLQNFTRRTLTNTLPYVVAVTPSQSLNPDYTLQMKVNEFQPVYNGDLTSAPRLVTNIEFTLVAQPSERVISSFSIGKQGTASSNRLDVITAGLEKMLQEIEYEAFTRLDPLLEKPVAP